MEETANKLFTNEVSYWLNKFTLDLAKSPEKIREALEKFPGDKSIVNIALEKGPSIFNEDSEACLVLINFVEFYVTGKISSEIEVNKKKEVLDDTNEQV